MYNYKVVINKDSVTEAIKPTAKKIKKIYIGISLIGIALMLFLVTLIFYSMGQSWFDFVIAGIAILIVCIVNTRNYKKKIQSIIDTTIERLKTIYHKDSLEYDSRLEDGKSYILSDGVEREMYLTDLISVNETENYVIPVYKGNIMQVIDKKSVSGDGDYKALISFLNSSLVKK